MPIFPKILINKKPLRIGEVLIFYFGHRGGFVPVGFGTVPPICAIESK